MTDIYYIMQLEYSRAWWIEHAKYYFGGSARHVWMYAARANQKIINEVFR